jgi:hypothetical protein
MANVDHEMARAALTFLFGAALIAASLSVLI